MAEAHQVEGRQGSSSMQPPGCTLAALSPHIASVALLSPARQGPPRTRSAAPALPSPICTPLTFLEVRSDHLSLPSRLSPLCMPAGAGPGLLAVSAAHLSPPPAVPHCTQAGLETQGPWLCLCSCVCCCESGNLALRGAGPLWLVAVALPPPLLQDLTLLTLRPRRSLAPASL